MKPTFPHRNPLSRAVIAALGITLALGIGVFLPASAEVADLSDVPLANSPSDAVLPNLMYILDDSGSMAWDYMPDNVHYTTTNYTAYNCKSQTNATVAARQCAQGYQNGATDGNTSDWGEPPYYATQFNSAYYNPNITYNPALTSAGLSMGNNVPTSAYKDRFLNNITYTNLITGSPATAPNKYYCSTPTPTGTNLGQSSVCQQVYDLTQVYPEIYWCNTSTPTIPADLSDTTKCRRNGINNVASLGYFNYNSNDPSSGGYPIIVSGNSTASFNKFTVAYTGHPYYFTIAPNEYCSDTNLTLCQLANADGTAPSGFSIPAPVRYCGSTTDAAATTAVSGGSPKCRKKFDQSSYPYPRYGRFTRVDIVPGTPTYPKGLSAVRTDCASATSCTYTEELQNFANWYGYYRTRLQTMKTATGRAFLPIDDRYRVGFLTIFPYSGSLQNPPQSVSSSKYLAIKPFDSIQKNSWYTLLYQQQTGSGGTPLRQALSRAGRHYAGIKDADTNPGINKGMINSSNPDPVQYSCQQNFALLTTDGYYSDTTAEAIDIGTSTSRTGSQVGNTDAIEDLVDPIFVSRSGGTLDGQNAQATVTTPTITSEQIICNGNAASTFSVATGGTQNPSGCGCTGAQSASKRLWQRDLQLTHTVGLTEGVITSNPPDTYSNTFTPVTSCTPPLIVTTVTPMVVFEDALCTGAGTATYTGNGGGTQPCGCAANQHRILRRAARFNSTVIVTDGVAAPATNGTPTFDLLSNVSPTNDCVSSTIRTDTQVQTQTEDASCNAGGTATFSTIGGSVACNTTNFPSATAGTRAMIRGTKTVISTRQVVNGVAGTWTVQSTTVPPATPPVTAGTPSPQPSFAIAPGSSFQAPLTRVDTFTFTATQVVPCTQTWSSSPPPNHGVTTAVSGFSIGGAASAGISDCGCTSSSSSKSRKWTRSATGTYTQSFTDGSLTGTSATTWVINSDTPSSCSSSTSSASGPTYSPSSPTPHPANTPPTGGTKSTGSNSGASLAAVQSPNPNPSTLPSPNASPTPGTVTTGSSSGTGLTLPTPALNPAVPTGVAPTVSDNSGSGGTTLAVTLTPSNPVTVAGTTTTTQIAGGNSNTLADVAMYYYKTDLRPCPGGTPANGVCVTDPKATDNVPNTSKDFATTQHMTTFTLGLGLQGSMDYTSDYEVNSTSDLAKIKTASTNCSFSTGICDWPTPVAKTPTTLDDLWHAAVNGRGVYYSASDPNSLADGLSGALAALKIQTAAASASATSSPNITQTDNFIYSSTFRTVKWDGEVVAQQIDTSTGNVLPTIVWSAQAQLDAKVAASTDTRTIYAFKTGATNNLTPFLYANLLSGAAGTIAAEQAYFTNKCTTFSQCALLASGDKTIANDGTNLVNYLRGQTQYQGIFRARDHVLGDPVNATPAFIKAPPFSFNDPVTPPYGVNTVTPGTFKYTTKDRAGMLYIAANDGMLHAFDGTTGAEAWAFVPRMVMPNMHNLATDNWDVNHTYLVDGSPQIMDTFDNRTDSAHPAWKTIIVGGLNKGGKGYYALDITDPTTPKGLWQTCSDSTLCENYDADMGYSYGNPVITKRASDGRWVVVVTSGLDNVTGSGTGRGFLYVLDAFTGAILRKVDTGVGDTTTPSGLSKISAFANDFNTNNTALYVYGGDLLGNVWRFDMSADPPTMLKLATLVDSTGKPQSITSRPELGIVSGNRVVFVGTGRYLGTNDLYDPATLSPALGWAYTQSIYALKDKGTAYGNPRTATPGLVTQTLTDNGATTRTASTDLVNWTTKDGWYMDLNPGGKSPGERVNLDPQLIQGTLLVVTNVPNNSACTVGGDSFTYQLDYSTGKAVSSSANGVVATKTVGQITVGVVVFRRPSGVFTGVGTGATGIKTPFGVNIGGSGGGGRRVSWRELVR